MIAGWVTALVMLGIRPLNESGTLFRLSGRLRGWLEVLTRYVTERLRAAQGLLDRPPSY